MINDSAIVNEDSDIINEDLTIIKLAMMLPSLATCIAAHSIDGFILRTD